MTIEERRCALTKLREQYHRTCPICGDLNPNGLRVVFGVSQDGTVEAEVLCGEDKQGYAGRLHGGFIASLLDGAMTNCLFSYGVEAVTGELKIRLLLPIQPGEPLVVRAWLNEDRSPLYYMKSEVHQGGHLAARASGTFMQKNTAEIRGRQEWKERTAIPSSEG